MANAHDLLMAQRAAMMAGKPLPYDAEVEYLESSGTQYIDTGLYPLKGMEFGASLTFERIPISSGGECYFGLYNSSCRFRFGIAKNNIHIGIGTGYNNNVGMCEFGRRYNISVNSGSMAGSVDGNVTELRGSFDPVLQKILLFVQSYNNDSVSRHCSSKLFYSYISNSGLMIVEFVPVIFTNELGDTEGAMYNRLGVGGMNPDGTARNDGLFRNRGTGTFGWEEKNGVYVPPT